MVSINKYILVRNLAVICIIGNLLYHLFPFPPLIWRVIFVLLCLYSVYYKIRHYKLLSVEKLILIFTCINLFHFFLCFLWIDTPSTTFIGNVLYAMLSFLFFSYLGKKQVLTEKFIFIITFLFTIAGAIYYYYAEQLALAKLLSNADSTTVNASVVFLVLFPILFFIKNKLVSLLLFSIYILFLLQSAKRGNIVAVVIPSILYIYYLFKDSKGSFRRILFLFITLSIIINYTIDFILEDDYLLMRYENTLSGDSSGRDIIYAKAWSIWLNSNNIVHYLFGYGFQGMYRLTTRMAHNDWFEILVDYGLIGVFCYLCIFIYFLNYIVHQSSKNVAIKYSLYSIFFIWFFKSFYSMGFCEEALVFLSIPFGICVNSSRDFYE